MRNFLIWTFSSCINFPSSIYKITEFIFSSFYSTNFMNFYWLTPTLIENNQPQMLLYALIFQFKDQNLRNRNTWLIQQNNLRFLHGIQKCLIIVYINKKQKLKMEAKNQYCLVVFILISALMKLINSYTFLPNCIVFSQPYQCSVCPVGLSCCQQSCSNCEGQIMCTSCINNYQFNSTLSICQLQSSCLQIACINCVSNYCTSCLDGFILNQYTYQCIKCPLYCSTCTLNGTCLGCGLEYFKNSQGTCEYCSMQNCLQCVQVYTCTRCVVGYTISSTLPICVSCPNHCQYCATQSQCSLCRQGYYLNSTQKCKPCATSCNTCYSSANNCTTCNINYFYQNNSCIECYTIIPYCISCMHVNNSINCLTCIGGMFPNNNTCQRCSKGCSTCTSANTCRSCESAYYLQNSTCIQCQIEGCTSCLNQTTCTSCQVGYYVTKNNLQCLSCMENCGDCVNITFCIGCLPGFTYLNGYCMACRPNCQSCSTFMGQCGECYNNFYVSSFSNNYQCLPCPLYCSFCISQSICQVCSPGYYLVNLTQCIPCQVQNCYICNNSASVKSCGICNNGYYLSSSAQQCLQCDPNCIVCSGQSGCNLCKEGFYLQQNSCINCIGNCSICNNALTCMQCSLGFFSNYNNTQCIVCSYACQQCVSQIQCSTCKSGYYLNFSSSTNIQVSWCTKCISPCLTCSDPSTCLSCLPQYTFVDEGICIKCPENCLVCNSKIGCIECTSYYTLTIRNSLQYCEACPANCVKCQTHIQGQKLVMKCLQCMAGTIILNSGQCFQCGSNTQTIGCKQCNSQGNCNLCLPGFFMADNNICVNDNYEQQSLTGYLISTIVLSVLFLLLLVFYIYLYWYRQGQSSQGNNINIQLAEEPYA